mmetsp:Transcript_32957/g.65250  ORF Transcript_32957/g.65250 Transcript_32957/m.65250 type:complete len:204 (-) Transcript_32957:127-738(-)
MKHLSNPSPASAEVKGGELALHRAKIVASSSPLSGTIVTPPGKDPEEGRGTDDTQVIAPAITRSIARFRLTNFASMASSTESKIIGSSGSVSVSFPFLSFFPFVFFASDFSLSFRSNPLNNPSKVRRCTPNFLGSTASTSTSVSFSFLEKKSPRPGSWSSLKLSKPKEGKEKPEESTAELATNTSTATPLIAGRQISTDVCAR